MLLSTQLPEYWSTNIRKEACFCIKWDILAFSTHVLIKTDFLPGEQYVDTMIDLWSYTHSQMKSFKFSRIHWSCSCLLYNLVLVRNVSPDVTILWDYGDTTFISCIQQESTTVSHNCQHSTHIHHLLTTIWFVSWHLHLSTLSAK